MRALVLLLALGSIVAGTSLDARPRGREQDAAFKAAQSGRIMGLRNIESLIVPRMRGASYLGPELDPVSARYRLKFMRGDRVIWVDVDARTGEVIRQSGD
jgi:uncharacterized membrane protein YkoI